MAKLINKVKNTCKSKFIEDVLTLQIGSSAIMGINFITSIFLARLLRPANYGVYALVFSLLGTIRLFTQFGLGPLTINQVAAATGGDDHQELTRYLAFFVKLGFLVHFSVAGIGYLIAPGLAELLFHQRSIGVMAQPLMLLIILGIFYTYGSSIIEGTRQMKRLAVLENGAALIRAVFLISVLVFGGGLREVIYASVAAYFLGTALAFFLMRSLPSECKRILPGFSDLLAQIKITPITAYLTQGMLVGMYNSLIRVFNYLPIFLLGRFTGVEVVGYYQVANKILSVPLIFFRTISRGLLPKLSQLYGKQDFDRLKKGFWRVTVLGSCLSLVLTIVFVLLVPYVLVIYGKDYSNAQALVFYLALYVALSGLDLGIMPVLLAVKRLKTGVILRLVTTLAVLPVGVYLVKTNGGRGAAVYYSLNQVLASLACLIFVYYALPDQRVSDKTKC